MKLLRFFGFMRHFLPEAPAIFPSEPVKERDAVGRVLDRAADLIEKRGWMKHAMKYEGRICALQAIRLAARREAPLFLFGVSELTLEARYRMTRHGTNGTSIPYWNDYPDRTKEEVVNALRHSAAQRTKLPFGKQ